MAEHRWLSDSEQAVWRSWLGVHAHLLAALNRQLQRDSQMSLQDFDVLVQLSEAPQERLRMSGLAVALQWEQSRLSHHVRRMAERGLVRREACADDARSSFACLTDQGRDRIVAAAPRHAALVRALMFDGLSGDDLAVMAKVLGRIGESVRDHECGRGDKP